ncbi:MAG: hypothetical protein HY657_17225 [Acidobacteria bacterium]|nr:hypothetical protein [Acidobacteriota bacterium]
MAMRLASSLAIACLLTAPSAAQTPPAPVEQAPSAQPPTVQAPPTSESQPPSPTASAGQGETPAEPQGFVYNPQGRRDPFVSLLRRGTETQRGAVGTRPSGLAGLGAAEVTLRGTIQGREGFVAILLGADQRTYIVRPGDKLLDGTIQRITQNDLVIVQQVNDPLSLETQREVKKVLREPEAN